MVRIDWIETHRFPRGVYAENDADERVHDQRSEGH